MKLLFNNPGQSALRKFILGTVCSLSLCINATSQQVNSDSAELPYAKIYSLALDGDQLSAMGILNEPKSKPLAEKSRKLKEDFQLRFGFGEDRSGYLPSRKSDLDNVLEIYVEYWRRSLLNPKNNFDSLLENNLSRLLEVKLATSGPVSRDSLDSYLKSLVESAGYRTTGFAKTGRLIDLLIWKDQQDTTYSFAIKKERITAPVIFMDNFLTLGWEEYSTLGKYYPGGWATKNGLYVVRKAYNLQSENFLISYLAHEGNHFSDYKKFPKLDGIDLEYRAKLIELSLANESLYKIIDFFIKNSNVQSSNAHPQANHYVIRDLSRAIFKKDLENDIDDWKKAGIKKINKGAYKIYKRNTKAMQRKGADKVSRFIM